MSSRRRNIDGTSDTVYLDGKQVPPDTVMTINEWHSVAIVRKRKRGAK